MTMRRQLFALAPGARAQVHVNGSAVFEAI